jgi:ABC-type glycerol-3-phosphate transport system permease component
VLVVKFHLYDTLAGIILPSAAFNIAIAILILVAFLRDIPSSLFEAMDIDGAGRLRVLRSLVFPLARPPLLGLGVFVILGTWNSLLLPLVTTTSNSEAVLPVALLRLESSDSANYPAIMASVVISAIPIVVLYVMGRRQLINGLVISSGGAGR